MKLLNQLKETILKMKEKKNEKERKQVEQDIEDFIKEAEKQMTLTVLANTRDEIYDEYTKDMLVKLQPVFNVAESFLEKEIVKFIEWKAVELVENNKKIMVLGSVTFPIGSEVIMEEGFSVKVSEDNQGMFQRVIRIVVPLDLAERGNIDDLNKFFRENYDLENIPNTSSLDDIGFSTENLSKEQIQQMMMFTHQSKDKIN